MIIKTQKDVIAFIETSKELMNILYIIDSLNLPNSCLCAGTLRSAVWDHLAGRSFRSINDIDVIYFDQDLPYSHSVEIQQKLNRTYPVYDWEVKNEVYMHTHSPDADPYHSAEDAIAKFPETPTAIGARIVNRTVQLIAPHGVEDLVNLIVRPTPFTRQNELRMKLYHQRVNSKNWIKEWPDLTISVD